MELCLFRIDQQEYAVPMASVREVLNRPRISPVPLAPFSLSGITHFRGEVVPVFAVDRLLTPGSTAAARRRSRVLVVTQASQVLGIQVDQVDEMFLHESDTQLPDPVEGELLNGVISCQNRTFKPVSLPHLFHSLQQTLSNVTLKLLN